MNTNQQLAAPATVTETELARTQAELAAGGDPFGDGDPLEFEQDDDEAVEAQATEQDGAATAAADPAADGAAKPGEATAAPEAGAASELTPEEIAATLAAISPQQASELTIAVPNVAGIAEKIAALDASREEMEEKWMAGELSDAERKEALRKFNEEDRKLSRELSKADTLAEIAQQQANSRLKAEADESAKVIAKIIERGAAAGIKYSDPEIAKAFDGFAAANSARMLAKGKTVADVFESAHKAVCELEGIAYQPQQSLAAAKPAARTAPPIPPSIRGLPQAASQTTGGGLVEVMRGLKGHAYTEQWDKLTPAQQAALLGD